MLRVCVGLGVLVAWMISSHFGTIFTILFLAFFLLFIIGRWSRGNGNEIRIGKSHKTDSKLLRLHERHHTPHSGIRF